jgi:4-azaleucine resistance transporter AzlC
MNRSQRPQPGTHQTVCSSPLAFSRAGLLAGARACLPIALGVGVYGILFGLLARQKGLSLGAALSMSSFVFAGASQLIAMDIWGPQLPMASLIVTTFIVNLRHVLMGAALAPWLSRLSALRAFGSLFFMTDESWAVTLGTYARNARDNEEPDGAVLLGSGLMVYLCWNLSTALGHTLVRGLDDPATYGLDFAFTAVFTALLVGLKPRRRDLLPLAAAICAALLGTKFLPGKWYILAGAFAGGLTAALGPVAGPAPADKNSEEARP